jgi:hypothetical protein
MSDGEEAIRPDGEDAIQAVVRRLSRPAAAGAMVIERAAILAEGADSEAIIAWIVAHAGEPEAVAPPKAAAGLHGARMSGGMSGRPREARRYVLPAAALG